MIRFTRSKIVLLFFFFYLGLELIQQHNQIPYQKSLKMNGDIRYLSQKLAKITDYHILV